ncbi:MAG: 50S ribosomal protein L21 [Bacteroidales bacterium]|nr:50S ribosomal protein L21 [Bacteroidales bacterium]
MYAIVDIAGQQFKVEKGKKIFVHQLPGEVGAEVSFDKVLLVSNNDKVSVGEPYVNSAVVSAQILSHLRGDKIMVFKKKRRKGYQVLNGHRQYFTELLIGEISETGPVKKPATKKEPETIQDASQPAAAEIKHLEKKTDTSGKSIEKIAEKADKPKEKGIKKAAGKTGKEPQKRGTVQKAVKKDADRSTPSSRAIGTKTKVKTTAPLKATKKTAEIKTRPAVKKAPAKKQAMTVRKTDTKKK